MKRSLIILTIIGLLFALSGFVFGQKNKKPTVKGNVGSTPCGSNSKKISKTNGIEMTPCDVKDTQTKNNNLGGDDDPEKTQRASRNTGNNSAKGSARLDTFRAANTKHFDNAGYFADKAENASLYVAAHFPEKDDLLRTVANNAKWAAISIREAKSTYQNQQSVYRSEDEGMFTNAAYSIENYTPQQVEVHLKNALDHVQQIDVTVGEFPQEAITFLNTAINAIQTYNRANQWKSQVKNSEKTVNQNQTMDKNTMVVKPKESNDRFGEPVKKAGTTVKKTKRANTPTRKPGTE